MTENIDKIEEDAVDQLRAELKTLPGKWYVVRTFSGQEKKAKQHLETRIQTLGVEASILQVEVPMQTVAEVKNGAKVTREKVRVPGYILVRMYINDSSWSAVRNTPGITGFVGNASDPVPMRAEEVVNMLSPSVIAEVDAEVEELTKEQKAAAVAKAKSTPITDVNYEIGQIVTVIDGPFDGMDAKVDAIDTETKKITVLVDIFGRETPVDLDYSQLQAA